MIGVLGEDLFIVEKILRRKRNEAGEVRYLVKWEGYDHEDNTWEPAESFSGCPNLLVNFNLELRGRKLERKGRRKRVDTGADSGTATNSR